MIRSARTGLFSLLLFLYIQNTTANPRIAVSIYPVFDLMNQIAGDQAETILVIPPGANPHTYEPVPSVIRSLQHINLFIGIEEHFDGWIKSFISEDTESIYLSDLLELNDSDHHTHDTPNPHIWLSISHARTITEIILETLCRLDSANVHFYKQNFQSLQSKLTRLDNKFHLLFSDVPNRCFIQWHAAWNYFASDYGLVIIGTIEHGHGDTPSVRDFQMLVQNAKKYHTGTIVIGLNADNTTAVSLANEIGGNIIRLDTIGDPNIPERAGYLEMMNFNASALHQALTQ